MGFGHRVYKNGDSRVPAMNAALTRVAAARDGQRWLDIHHALETEMLIRTGIKPDLDFPTGPAYHLIGFDIAYFTPIFVMSRITGWTAHIIEQTAANVLIRPSANTQDRPNAHSRHPERFMCSWPGNGGTTATRRPGCTRLRRRRRATVNQISPENTAACRNRCRTCRVASRRSALVNRVMTAADR